MGKASNGTIKVDTNVVKNTVNTINSINNSLENDFQSVISSVNALDSAWDGSASSKIIGRFNTIKSNYCGNSGRKAVVSNYLKFLCDAVAIGYEQTETTNVKLSELFK